MSSEHAEVRSMLSALEPHVRSSVVILSEKHVGTALLGLQQMKSEHEEHYTVKGSG
jgi:hypothetical protein